MRQTWEDVLAFSLALASRAKWWLRSALHSDGIDCLLIILFFVGTAGAIALGTMCITSGWWRFIVRG